jgi:hypothetical protein
MKVYLLYLKKNKNIIQLEAYNYMIPSILICVHNKIKRKNKIKQKTTHWNHFVYRIMSKLLKKPTKILNLMNQRIQN